MNQISWEPYNGMNGVELARSYDSISADGLNSWMRPFLPPYGEVLDIGAGSGRDAYWFSKQGLSVTCVEPAQTMREAIENKRKFDANLNIVDDSLPRLAQVRKHYKKYDVISLMAVWQHVDPLDRPASFVNLGRLLKYNGCILMTLRHGETPKNRMMLILMR